MNVDRKELSKPNYGGQKSFISAIRAYDWSKS